MDLPDSNDRAAVVTQSSFSTPIRETTTRVLLTAPLPSSTASPVVMPVVTQPKIMEQLEQESTLITPRPADWLDGDGVDRKSSNHQNNVEQGRGAFSPSSSEPSMPIGSSNIHCSLSHWDSTAAVCLSKSLVFHFEMITHLVIFCVFFQCVTVVSICGTANVCQFVRIPRSLQTEQNLLAS